MRGGKAHAHRERHTKYYMQRNHLRRCQHVRYVRANDSGDDEAIHCQRRGGDHQRGGGKPQPTHSAGESCEKQSPPETQRDVREHAHYGHYWMKTPDAVRSVTKKETRDGIEGPRGHPLLNAEAEERPRGRGRDECPREDTLRERALLEVTGAHGTKETTRVGPLKARLTNVPAERLMNALQGTELMRRIELRSSYTLVVAALALSACARPSIDIGARMPTRAAVEARELTADQQVAQALNRLTFGPRPGDAAEVRRIGV